MVGHIEEDIIEKDFIIVRTLGFGSFGEVKLACHLPTNTHVAVKVLEKNHNSVSNIKSEVQILQSLEHRNIVRFFHIIDTLKMTYVVMEYVPGKDLHMLLKNVGYLKEKDARPIFQQIVAAVQFLHKRLITHRDIKLENILIDRGGNIKLCDFGMAIQLKEGQMLKKFCGSLLYMAPEILARKPFDGLAGDMWSLGIVLYVLVTGQYPYFETTAPALYRLITNTKFAIPFHLSKPCYIILAQLLKVETQHRITICQLLERKWLGKIEQHMEASSKEILPRVLETMNTIGYTHEEIVSSLILRQPNNKITATFKILKHKLSCEESHHQNEKPWFIHRPVHALPPLLPLKRRASEPAFPTFQKVGTVTLKEEKRDAEAISWQ
ncbi:sperm motility kinase-like [Mesocricetus auratus]|uniref:non-specific serine/threonine protein kinase n=1 Tax=Mesocricetus auratus TaxID=10036 RepID=A0ABM2WB37_MESAU|nr:sperm motility kinase-like [Mesocricetus auratus]